MEENINLLQDNPDNIEFAEDFLNKRQNSHEKINDIFITQCILAILLVTGFFVLNIFYPQTAENLLQIYRNYSDIKSDEIIEETVEFINGVIK